MIFRDSVDARAIPQGTDIVGGYGDGRFIWSPSWWDGSNGWDLHPKALHLVFVVAATSAGDALDVENGDATPAEAPGWVKAWKRNTGWRRAMVYCNDTTWFQVVLELRQAGIDPAGDAVDYLIATLDGTVNPKVPPGAKPPVAVQFKGSTLTGGQYDEWSIIDPSWIPGGGSIVAGTVVLLDGSGNDPVVDELINNGLFAKSVLDKGGDPNASPGGPWIAQVLNGMPAAVVAALPPAATGGVTTEQIHSAVVEAVTPLLEAIQRIENALKSA